MLKEAQGRTSRPSSTAVTRCGYNGGFRRVGLGWHGWAAWSVATVKLSHQIVLHRGILKTTTEVEVEVTEEIRPASSWALRSSIWEESKVWHVCGGSHTTLMCTQILEASSSQPVSCNPFGVIYQISFISNLYVTTHNSSKMAVIKQQQNNLIVMVGIC